MKIKIVNKNLNYSKLFGKFDILCYFQYATCKSNEAIGSYAESNVRARLKN